MATITLTLPVSGSVITAGLHANNYTAIQTAINGGLDQNNFAAGKIFDPAKIMQNAATDGQSLVWDNANSKWVPGSAGSKILYDSGYLGVAAASIDSGAGGFSTSFTHLRIVIIARSTAAALNVGQTLLINNDAGANYDYEAAVAFGGGAANIQSNGAQGGNALDLGSLSQLTPGATSTAGIAMTAEAKIPFYSQTTFKKKIEWVLNGIFDQAVAARQYTVKGSGLWRSTAAVNRVSLALGAGNLDVGSRMIIYGEM